jgi:hypothetical protein
VLSRHVSIHILISDKHLEALRNLVKKTSTLNTNGECIKLTIMDTYATTMNTGESTSAGPDFESDKG